MHYRDKNVRLVNEKIIFLTKNSIYFFQYLICSVHIFYCRCYARRIFTSCFYPVETEERWSKVPLPVPFTPGFPSLSLVAPLPLCLFYCKILRNVATFLLISPGSCHFGKHAFRPLFFRLPYSSRPLYFQIFPHHVPL